MNYFQTILLLIGITGSTACSKNKNLETDPSSSITTIRTLADCQSLLNNKDLFNETPVLGEISADDCYIAPIFLNSLSIPEKNAYTWQVEIFEGQKNVADYSTPYAQVHIANQVLTALPRIKVSKVEQAEKNNIEGTAYFFRAYAFFNLLQLFAPPYDITIAASSPGIALPLTPDINTIYSRASLEASYKRVITDLRQAKSGLIDKVYRDQPSKPAADAMLARVFLSMGDYLQAGAYADSCLQNYNTLMNYNLLDLSLSLPIPNLNDEILYYSNIRNNNGIFLRRISRYSFVDSILYGSYAVNDLRKKVFFNRDSTKVVGYKASYTGNQFAFSGLATDEVYLISAECKARAGDLPGALQDLNTLLANRFSPDTFQPYSAATPQEVLKFILEERRKELVYRGLRFTDLRRLNKSGAGIVLNRVVNGMIYQLSPNDLRYTLPIPDDALDGSLIVQNPRQ
ncbi:hypothetical protein A4H97_29815 [Niastella yeongjuensis]|uniref:Uncharacterized protein n=1 Tax=Niastella yeongjuensis TaxID=354355 RepID=A0A1V9EPJ6_9BACT|nr:RagB/SusD family nutrient uptake outer membrane protein [Niastella yeongjuensis]OQP48036.1 hypothetical protein A4H97_29815 [Niastella yeongjuensis]SEO24355.1 SusD family protein [Niastella yeongjuensis]